MAEKKIYSAFVSSVFEGMQDTRNVVIRTLLHHRIFPICMEHFTVSSSQQFAELEKRIDESDFFIILLGDQYGSCDENGISWTEREYLYAMKRQKDVLAVFCKSLLELQSRDPAELTGDQSKQIAFSRRVSYARKVSDQLSVETIINQFFSAADYSNKVGWTRVGMSDADIEQWREQNKVFDLRGNWYHVHLSEDDETYIRVGNIKIEQDFTPDKYLNLHIKGENYSVKYYKTENQKLVVDTMKSTSFHGDYTMQENGEIYGIFNSKRKFSGTFNSQTVGKGVNRGIHDFNFDVSEEITMRIDGEFHDEAPSPKLGRIFIFRSEADRNEFLLENREDVIEQR